MVRVLGREEAKVFVLGEVLRPNSLTLRNGRLTLNEALSDSGGVNPVSADPRQIYVIRAQQPTQPQIFHLETAHGQRVGQFLSGQGRIAELAQPGLGKLHVRLLVELDSRGLSFAGQRGTGLAGPLVAPP